MSETSPFANGFDLLLQAQGDYTPLIRASSKPACVASMCANPITPLSGTSVRPAERSTQ
jgi:hypothetical protein